MRVETGQLKAFLLDAGLISESQFDNCQKKAEERRCGGGGYAQRSAIAKVKSETGDSAPGLI